MIIKSIEKTNVVEQAIKARMFSKELCIRDVQYDLSKKDIIGVLLTVLIVLYLEILGSSMGF